MLAMPSVWFLRVLCPTSMACLISIPDTTFCFYCFSFHVLFLKPPKHTPWSVAFNIESGRRRCAYEQQCRRCTSQSFGGMDFSVGNVQGVWQTVNSLLNLNSGHTIMLTWHRPLPMCTKETTDNKCYFSSALCLQTRDRHQESSRRIH